MLPRVDVPGTRWGRGKGPGALPTPVAHGHQDSIVVFSGRSVADASCASVVSVSSERIRNVDSIPLAFLQPPGALCLQLASLLLS